MQFASVAVTEKFSPNTMELQKMIANSMALLANDNALKTVLVSTHGLAEGVQEESKESSA